MAKIRHSGAAREDLLDIWSHIATDDMQAADRIYDRIGQRVEILATFPKAGVARNDIAPEARCLSEPPYLILYREIPEGVQVVRVLHGARRIDLPMFLSGIE